MAQPFTQLTRDNLLFHRSAFLQSLSKASHIAIDTEFTGLGVDRDLRSSNLKERYNAMRKVVSSYALLCVGVSIFELVNSGESIENYRLHGFEFLLSCQMEYTMSPKSAMFLASSGFDFTRQALLGIPFVPTTMTLDKLSDTNVVLRELFTRLLNSTVPLVVHNGWLDLMYLYQAFYAPLPDQLDVWLADMQDLVKGGIYDTKWLSESLFQEPISFLAYLGRKTQREHARKRANKQKHVRIEAAIPLKAPLIRSPLEPTTKKQKKSKSPYCEQFAQYGFCSSGHDCLQSHDLDVILDHHEKHQLQSNDASFIPGADLSFRSLAQLQQAQQSITPLLDQHAAHADAFMTGLLFADYKMKSETIKEASQHLYVVGHSRPLLIVKSAYVQFSPEHERRRIKS